ncbi:MAG: hypothetical protein MJZ76_08230, partial [Bacteroidales bacterium]|nr:hypothetical protein [Bacteroidales bacterium]
MEKHNEEIVDKDHSQVENLDEYLNMDIRSGVSNEAKKICENPFLTRGVSAVPNIDEAHCSAYNSNACKLSSYDWISKLDITTEYLDSPFAEVRFKNGRKDFFIIPSDLALRVGDIVSVEANTGFDIGIVSMLGASVRKQMSHKKVKEDDVTKKIYRLAKYTDIDKWISAVKQEHLTMLSSRYIAWDINLKMTV